MDITLAQIAERIHPTGGDVATVVERLKHWTKQGILKPYNRPAHGVPRLYEPNTVVEAALLNCLADRGVLVFEKRIQYALGLLREAADRWARGTRDQCWLELALAKIGPSGKVDAVQMHYHKLAPTLGTTVAVIVNVSTLLAEIRWGAEPATVRETQKKSTPPARRRRRTRVSA
jgi:hypothetical protein